MKKLVILQFDGEFSTGYKVTLEVGEEGKRPNLRIRGELPSALDIIQCFQNWRDVYRSLDERTRIKTLGAKNVNIDDLKQKCDERSQNLLNSFNSWLQSQSFNPIINCLSQQDWDRGDEIRVILSTDCQEIRKLPWHLWNGFDAIPYFRITPFEVALSAPDAERRERPFREKIRILIILGDSTGINVKADEQLLQKYCGDAEIVTLVKPLRQELNNYLQDEIGWDMLFFSGHSQTQGTQGRIFLNHDDSLTMAELRDTLLPAIAKRLQLAIFNSCDGLGIARELESLQIPQVIVMREPVPDKVAQEFLKHFLKSFTGGSSLCNSVGYARQQLQRLESQFPCASWLPVIVQNQLEVPPTWQSLGITRSPYRGLMAFREEDAENFFGREAFVEQLVIDVNRKPLVAVIGASGSGKSSVVFAGLIPQLRQYNILEDNGGSDCDRSMGRSFQEHRQWQIISFRPGKNPFESLAIALEEFRGIAAELLTSPDAQISRRRQELELEIDLKRDISSLQKIIADILHTLSPTHLLLVIDQFEEVYTLCPNAQERQIFIDSLLNAVSHTPMCTLLITLRADFLGKAMSYQPLGKALQDYPPSLLVPMSRKELERAIIQPAARFSVELEEGLVNKLIDDVGSGEGSLPLQQFALTQLWGKQRPGLLTHQAYTEIGGVTQALANHAEAVYAGLSETQQKRAQRLFIQLVQPGEGTEDTRRLATRDEVGDYWDLVTLLANERLLVTNRNQLVEDTVEVVHEALIRNWGRLRGWMDDNREFRVWQERLKVALQQWVESGKDEGVLLRSATLAVAEDWLQKRGEEVSKPQRWFIEKSVELQERERKQKQRLRRSVITGLVCGLVVISGFAAVSEIRRTDAEIGRLSVTAEKYFAQNDHEAALTEVIKAGKLLKNIWKPWITSENRMLAVSTLQQVVDEFPIQTLKGHAYTDSITSVSFSPDGKILASELDGGTVILWDINTGKEIKTLREPGVRSVSFSPDGRTLAFAGDGITLWDTTTGRKIKTLMGYSIFNDVKFSPNGKTFASASHYPVVTIWDTTTGRKIRDLVHGHRVNQVSYSPDGKILASASDDHKVTLWDTSNGRELKTFEETDQVAYVSFSPDGKIVASAPASGSNVTIRDVSTGKTILTFLNHSDHIAGISFSPDSKIVASASIDNTIQLWDVNTGKVVSTVRANITPLVQSISFSPDGRTVAFPSDKNTVRLWNITNTTRAKTMLQWGEYHILTNTRGTKTKISSIRSFSFSPDNKIVAGIVDGNAYSFQPGGRVKLWNTSNGKEIKTLLLGDKTDISAISFSLDGKTIAFALDDGTITFWDVSTGEKIKTFKDHTISVDIEFSSDDKTLASASSNGTITLWDVNTGIKIKNFRDRADSVDGNGFNPDVDFSPDGKILAFASLAGTGGTHLNIVHNY
ncbi:CHAT domain-containing protein [Aulosira sp. FACHB-615]|uniref:nSTAND1 domain-containing NTPase n=1 Tax=Aulosira sp. FACHB-615 TaxID=2692777 RepID=UPI001689022D|nr:CHAT domain-containing protein [Aulosira sp. FACHB-615]MBD2492437.1 PD40 domain-containing protein [Aulosira sp. FACHB-615]